LDVEERKTEARLQNFRVKVHGVDAANRY